MAESFTRKILKYQVVPLKELRTIAVVVPFVILLPGCPVGRSHGEAGDRLTNDRLFVYGLLGTPVGTVIHSRDIRD